MERAVYVPAEVLARLKSRMHEFGLTQEQLANILSLHQPRLSEMFAGQKPFQKKALAKLIALFELPDLQQYVPDPLSETEKEQQECLLGLRMLADALVELPPHSRRELWFSLALDLEAQPPYGHNRFSRVLRALSRLKTETQAS